MKDRNIDRSIEYDLPSHQGSLGTRLGYGIRMRIGSHAAIADIMVLVRVTLAASPREHRSPTLRETCNWVLSQIQVCKSVPRCYHVPQLSVYDKIAAPQNRESNARVQNESSSMCIQIDRSASRMHHYLHVQENTRRGIARK